MARKKVKNKGCGFNKELNQKCLLGDFEFTIELAGNSYNEEKDLIACRGCAKQDKYNDYKKAEVIGEAGVKYCIIYQAQIEDGYKVQLGKNWVECIDCKWKRKLTNKEKEAPAQNKVKKCESCDSIRILFYKNEPSKDDSIERERERERAKLETIMFCE